MSVSQATSAAAKQLASSSYSVVASSLHWASAVPMIASVGAILQAQNCPKKSEERQYWMHYHESFGVLTAMILVPRLAYRVVSYRSYILQDLPGTKPIEKVGARLSMAGLHAFGIVCAATGVGMNYYSGWGMPFFWTRIPGIEKTPENKEKYGALTYQAYDIHKFVGNYGKWLIPLHVAGTGMHAAKGQKVFSRINPFRKTTP